MKRPTLTEYLAPVPLPIRRSMLEGSAGLEAGAAAVVGRLFTAVAARHEPVEAPSAQSFRDAAASESAFRMLLRTLTVHAPMVSTAAAVPVKAEWVARRPRPAPTKKMETPSGQTAQKIDTRTWPAPWQGYFKGLAVARIKPSSLRRYRASIHRCAQLVGQGIGSDALNFLTAYQLAEAFQATPPDTSGRKPLRPSTIANYIEGLVALGNHGGADPEALAGVRFMRDHLLGIADASDKLKFARIAEIMEKGGFDHVACRIAELRAEAQSLPDHAAAKTSTLQAAAICAVSMNKPGRTGDVSRWQIGKDLQRDVDGSWRLQWQQEKNARETEAGRLWPEVCEILDELILGGRPGRFIHLRYRELIGANWLTLSGKVMAAKWPSAMVNATLGIPLHDLRTLAADYLRLHDPDHAAGIIRTHLGHRTLDAGDSYQAACAGDAAARSWAAIRSSIAAG